MGTMHRRKQLLVPDEVQHALMLRVTIHWCLFVIANFFALAIWIWWIESPAGTSDERYAALIRVAIPLLACSLVVVPVFLYDFAKISNQFAGPIRRIRDSLTKHLDGNKIEEVQLRKKDFWQSLAHDFNRLVSRHNSESIDTKSPASKSNAYTES
jgi:uncharacterized membrane protein